MAAWRNKNNRFQKRQELKQAIGLRKLQFGESLELPISRPMPSIGPGCHELRINDENVTWRIIYRIDSVAITIADVFKKKMKKTPKKVIKRCQSRLNTYDSL